MPKNSKKLRIAGTVSNSIVDGPGFRYALFVQGCPHKCEGCHNPETWDFNGGKSVDTDYIFEQIKGDPLLDGVTFSGGEPFGQAGLLAELGEKIHGIGLNIMTYTGYTWEEITSKNSNDFNRLLNVTDILVDGRFILSERSLELHFKGSRNQRIIDVKKSLETGNVCLAEL